MKALYLTKDPEFKAEVAELDESALPEGDVTLKVAYSTVNFKDALAITNKSPIVRKWPMVAGIDAAGVVEESSHPRWKRGDEVILNGWGVGEGHWGGLAQKARFKGDWLVRRPASISLRHAMAIGTAGYTAMLCAMAIEREGIRPERGEVLVTGATGGRRQRGRGDHGPSRLPRRGLHGQGRGGVLRDLARGGHDAEPAMSQDRHGHAARPRPLRR